MKNNKWLVPVIGVLVALVVALVVLVVILFVKDDDERKDGGRLEQTTEGITEERTDDEVNNPTGETGAPDAPENPTGETDAPGNSTGNADNPDDSGVYSVVIDGFEFVIPYEYSCFYNEELGAIIELENAFQLSISAEDKTYQDVLKNRDKLTEKAVNAGGEIVQEPTELTINGKEYIYFVTDISGDKVFVMYTQGVGTDRAIAGQLVLLSDDMSNEDVLEAYADIVADARETDKPDSTIDDIVEQTYQQVEPDGAKSESTLTFNGDSITFAVPEGFYSQGIYNSEYAASEDFVDRNYDVMVECRLIPTENYDSAEGYIENMVKWESDSVNDIKVMTEKIGDIVCYHFVSKYEYEDKTVQNLYVAYNNSDTSIFTVEVFASDIDYDINFDMFREFLVVK